MSSAPSLSPLLLIVEEKHSGMFMATVLLLKFLVMVSVHYLLIGFLFPVYFGYFMCLCVCVCVCRLLEVSAWGRQKGSWWMLLEACISCREAPK